MTKALCLNGTWQFRQSGNGNWLPAKVPGCNFTDLLDNNLIKDPFYRDEEHQLQWIETKNWEYRKYFDVTETMLLHSDLELVMDGLDTYCNVYLNNILIHENNNMFVGHRVSCKEWLCIGNNELRMEFRSPINEVMPTHLNNGFTYPAENDKSEERLSVFTRKAPYHYGWDWGPRFVTSGIWQSITLECVDKARIENVYVQQLALDENKAELLFQVSLAHLENFDGTVVIHCQNVAGLDTQLSVQANSSMQTIEIPLAINNPQRWWPNGLGDAFLHQFSISLLVNSKVLHSQAVNIGLRAIEVVNEADEFGECFFLKVNGHPTFMKGANYIPSDSFLNRVNSQKYQKIFSDAVSANMNMLRVWGGGIYEDDEFYRLADQHGILIWQDFMFACSLYPSDAGFIDTVKQEVEYNVKRLRNHACVALWCGNNETEMGIEFWDWPKTFNYSDELYQQLKQDYDFLFKNILPNMVAELDAQRFYFSSSPIGFWENKADDNRGDNHYWGVWHGEEPFSEYKKRVPRFMSEYGFQSFPLLSSVKQYSEPDDWHIDSSVMKTHQKHPRGNSLIRQYMKEEFRDPKDFESFLYLSQVQQALGLKIAFEAHRSAVPFCMGTLYWQFNDCWPVASWSGIDYYGKWKALHYQAKRSFEPLGVFIDTNDEDLSINIVSDVHHSKRLQLVEQLISHDGSVLWSNQQDISITPLSSERIATYNVKELLTHAEITDAVFIAQLMANVDGQQSIVSEAFHYFVPTKSLSLKIPNFIVETQYSQGNITVLLSSDTLARQVYVSLDGDSKSLCANFSDNFFDLMPNIEKCITVSVGELNENEVAILLNQLTIMSIVDTYKLNR